MRPEYNMILSGRNIRNIRIRKNFSVEQVREYMKLGSVQSVYKWESGKCFPSVDNFMALSELYEINPLEMLIQKDWITQASTLRIEYRFKELKSHNTLDYTILLFA